MKPLKPTSTITNAAQQNINTRKPATPTEPDSKKSAKMKAGTVHKSDAYPASLDAQQTNSAQNTELSHTAPITTAHNRNRKQTIPANLVRELLSDEAGLFDREKLLAFARSPVTIKEVRPIPRTWPAQLLSAKDIRTWSDKLVVSHQEIFNTEGRQSYAKAVIDAVFPNDVNKPAHLPDKLEAFCRALDEQVIQQCRNSGLTFEEFDTLRMRVLGGFINGRVLCQHLRPKTPDMEEASGWQMDADLLAAAGDKLNLHMHKLLCISDALLEPIAQAIPQFSKQATSQPVPQQTLSPKLQIQRILGAEDVEDLEKSEYADEFYKRADTYLNSSVKHKRFLISALMALYTQIPSDANNQYFSKLDKAVRFIYDKRHTLDKLNVEGRLYMLEQIELIAVPDRRATLSKASLMKALYVAEGILPPLQEVDEDNDSIST